MPEYAPNTDMNSLRLANLMARTVLSRQGRQADGASVQRLADALLKRPAFGALRDDPRAAKLVREGRGADLCALFNAKDRRLNGPKGPYARPAAMAKSDSEFLKTVSDEMKGGGAASGSPARIERESALLAELTKRMDQAQMLLEKGIQLDENASAALVTAAKRYNDNGTAVPGGGRDSAYSKQAMSIMKRYMPQQEFNAYCRNINAARGAVSPSSRGYVDPENIAAIGRANDARPARELLQETRRALSKKLTVDACAAAAAIQKLSKGNPGAMITKQQLKAEMDAYKKPGSAFMQVMKDSEARGKLASLASKGQIGKVGSTIVEEARKHSARAAQWQIDQAAAAAGAGKGSKQTMAAVLAAKELVNNSDPATGITKDAFDQRADAIAASQAFSKLAQQYDRDPSYRRSMDSEIAAGDKSNAVLLEYKKEGLSSDILKTGPEIVPK